ncbi:galactosyltransferase-related protein [Rhizobium alvei]|uniref:Galactosyltransferase-related protein n=1 Tax=Rhizobium alvei TaxID=1132659 RepID=A0ABT8YGA2_9HYPH|nr:galactosyltransferase-related protein [Rhizobium alvei]MDO6962697.1 galactosyltransferase-related protein [Rhizobium alvei]
MRQQYDFRPLSFDRSQRCRIAGHCTSAASWIETGNLARVDRFMDVDTRITLIVPLRLTGRTYEGEQRLTRLCDIVPRDLYDILISDYGTEDAHAGPLHSLEKAGVSVCRHPAPHPLFSIGHARDFGVQNARQPVIMFNDIDFCGTEAMYRAIHAEVVRRQLARKGWEFFCVPVLFLTEEATSRWLETATKGKDLFEGIDVDAAEQATDAIQSTAYGSSAMVINRRHYLEVGGHDKAFSGHGAEDYDILHRLSTLAPLGPRPHDYFKDFRNNGVRHYWGFRPFFALYGLEAFARGLHLVHLWHPRRQERGYFRAAQNFKHLRKLMVGFDRRARQPAPLTDIGRGTRHVLAIGATTEDRLLLRPLLSLASQHVQLEMSGLPDGPQLEKLARSHGADYIVLGPSLCTEPYDPGTTLPVDLQLLCLCGPLLYGAGQLELRMSGSSEFQTVTVTPIRSPTDTVVAYRWSPVLVPGLGEVGAPAPAAPRLFSEPLFASFGAAIADRKRHSSPKRRAKSPIWLRAWRRLTGR